MTQSQLNRAVSRATGEDCELIDRHGFSLVEVECPVQDEDLLALVTDWQRFAAENEAAIRRQTPFGSIA